MLVTGTAPTIKSQKVTFQDYHFIFSLLVMHTLLILSQGFGGKQTEHCCPGFQCGSHGRTVKGIQMEERLRTVVLLISVRVLTLASGVMRLAPVQITMFVKEVSE